MSDELIFSGRTEIIRRNKIHIFLIFITKKKSEFTGKSGFTCSVKPYDKNGINTCTVNVELLVLTTHKTSKFIMHDFYKLLTRVYPFNNFFTKGLFFNFFNKLFNDFKVNISF